ncbi:A/G-specific adenine glycosylase [soil metagenome]
MNAANTELTAREIAEFHRACLAWFDVHARELPWRGDVSAWSVMVSEFMLQQTPVARVLPVYEQWMARWPSPEALVAEAPGEAVRAWGRLGYPRRALRLHAAAQAIVERHGGVVPDDVEALRALPGVGDYTSAAIASFAYQQSHVVLDTNVRRVLARVAGGAAYPAAAVSAVERQLGEALKPAERADRWAIAVMELGALVCTSTSPDCPRCPVREICRWRRLDYPAYDGPPRRGQTYAGTDRQVRGKLLAALRDHEGPVTIDVLDATWHEAAQRMRALDSLVADGLVELVGNDLYGLPT